MTLIRKSSLLIVLFGIALVVLAPLLGTTYVKPKRVLLKDSMTLEFEELGLLSFRVDQVRAGYLVRIFVNVTDVVVGAASYRPILDVVLLDQQGLDLIENNQTVNYVYVKATDIQDPILLTASGIKQAGEYYVVFLNRFPVRADVPVTVTDEWDEWTVNTTFYILIIIGVVVVLLGLVWGRVAGQIGF